MPDLVEVNNLEDVAVIAINVEEPKDVVDEYITESGHDLEWVLDEEGVYSNLFFVRNLPTTYFVDEDGVLLGSVPGQLTETTLNDILEQIRNDEL